MNPKDVMNVNQFTWAGTLAALAYWVAIVGGMSWNMACINARVCRGGDFFLVAIIAAFMAPVALVIGGIVSDLHHGIHDESSP